MNSLYHRKAGESTPACELHEVQPDEEDGEKALHGVTSCERNQEYGGTMEPSGRMYSTRKALGFMRTVTPGAC